LAQPKEITNEKTVAGVLRVVRNALAHGNIFTHNDPISRLIFVEGEYKESDKVKHYTNFKYVSVSPEDFILFLKRWFEFLKAAHISTELAAKSIENAA
jgi:hypothetical protein